MVTDVPKFKCDCSSCNLCKYRAFTKEELDLHLKQACVSALYPDDTSRLIMRIASFPYYYSPPVAGRHYWPVPSGRDAKALRLNVRPE